LSKTSPPVKLAEERLRDMHTQLAHMTRVTTTGALAASIAHEINQPLCAVVNNANASLRYLGAANPKLEEAREGLACIVQDGSRASEVIGRIRALLKRTAPETELVDVNDLIWEISPLIRGEARKESVSAIFDLSHGLPGVEGDRVQLHQVILNLVLNGIESMATVDRAVKELTIRSATQEGGEVLVAVSDTGIGIDSNKEQRFKAFYTTKPEGMGMGLSISRSIIEAHGGKLWAEANKGAGATFQFTLPVFCEVGE
jgi:signal transduction histidine kinase